jgi:hypothetical protein
MATSDVRAAELRAGPLTEATFSYVNWGAIALAAAALAFVLHSFGIAIGLAMSSTASRAATTYFNHGPEASRNGPEAHQKVWQIKRPRGRSSPGASYLTLGRSTVTGSAAAAPGCR